MAVPVLVQQPARTTRDALQVGFDLIIYEKMLAVFASKYPTVKSMIIFYRCAQWQNSSADSA